MVEPRTMAMQNDLEKSRTQKKRAAIDLQKIGSKLVFLSDDQLKRMALSPVLLEAIMAIRNMKSHGARRRQLQYIGTLMRQVDVPPIEQALMEIEQGSFHQAKAFQRLEGWRNRLVSGDDALLDEILDTFPDADRQRLGQLVRSARKEKEKNDPPRSSRNLFRYLQQLDHSQTE